MQQKISRHNSYYEKIARKKNRLNNTHTNEQAEPIATNIVIVKVHIHMRRYVSQGQLNF